MIARIAALPADIRQYLLVTFNYWNFTLTDGALRMLVVLHFHQLGYSPLSIALLFVFYELFGVVTNLVGGWLGSRIGLNRTMNAGLGLQIIALLMLTVPPSMLTVPFVMFAQALSGIAKDLNKMSAKSSIKLLAKGDRHQQLFKWVAILTGSKNAFKGVGFFLGGLLLAVLGFQGAMFAMSSVLLLVLLLSLFTLHQGLGKAKQKAKFSEIFSKSRSVNVLSAARLFLFGARDIWFVVALPVYMVSEMGWDNQYVGGFLALWVIAYGLVQSCAPAIIKQQEPGGGSAIFWVLLLSLVPAAIAMGLYSVQASAWILLPGLLLFGFLFAVNSSLHSYLILAFAKDDGVSLDVGFYYMANAMGRLLGTVLSGWVFQGWGLEACLLGSTGFLLLTLLISFKLQRQQTHFS